MTENEALKIVQAALRCGALSADHACGFVKMTFQAFDNFMTEIAFASVTMTKHGLNISEMRSTGTPDAQEWESKLAQVLEGLDRLRMNFSERVAA